jgi:alkylhydroperoxidase family enzyme
MAGETTRGLPARSSSDTTDEVARVLEKLEAGGGDNLITRFLGNSPNGFRPYVLMSNALLNKAALPPVVREVVILALAGRRGTRYEWWEHEAMSEAAGVTDEQRAAIAAGTLDDEAQFDDDERFAMRVGLRLAAGDGVDDADWTSAIERWGSEGLLDLVLTVGWWGGFVPTVIEALQLDELVPRTP